MLGGFENKTTNHFHSQDNFKDFLLQLSNCIKNVFLELVRIRIQIKCTHYLWSCDSGVSFEV